MTISLLKQVGSEGAGKKGRKAALCKQKQSLRQTPILLKSVYPQLLPVK